MEHEVKGKGGGEHMLDLDWVWPVLASIGLIVVLAAFEFLSIVIAAKWDTDETSDWPVEPKRAA